MLHGRHHSRRLCPTCGQEIVIPNDVTSLNIFAGQRLILMKLFRASPNPVSFERLSAAKKASLFKDIHAIRGAIIDAGLPYRVLNVQGFGYCLVKKAA